MKRLLSVLLFIVFSMVCAAQEKAQPLIVYDVGGKVLIIRKRQPVEKRQLLSPKEQISIPEGGFVKLLDKDNQKMYTLRNQCKGRISELIASQKKSERSLTKQYFAYILRSLTRKDTEANYNSGLATASFRNDADSLLCDIDSLQEVVDSLNDVITDLTTDSTKTR